MLNEPDSEAFELQQEDPIFAAQDNNIGDSTEVAHEQNNQG